MLLRSMSGFVLASLVMIGSARAQAPKGTAPGNGDAGAPKTAKERAGYAIGVEMGRELQSQKLEVDIQMVAKGLIDSLTDNKPLMSGKEMRDAMDELRQARQARHNEIMANMPKLGEKAKKEGPAFLAENKKKPGVTTLASGLQYKVLKAGKGSTPKATDIITAHYRGTLLDGSEFDSSYRRDEPLVQPVAELIPGWKEALQLMKVGDKWQLFIPAELAYGERGAGEDIPPNSTLIFEMELLDVAQGAPTAPGTVLPAPKE